MKMQIKRLKNKSVYGFDLDSIFSNDEDLLNERLLEFIEDGINISFKDGQLSNAFL